MKGFNFLCSKCIRTHFERIFIKVELVLIRNSVKGTFLELFGVIKNILGINLNEIEKLTLLMYLLLDTILHMFAECMPHETFYAFQCFALLVESVFFRSFVQIESTLFNLSRLHRVQRIFMLLFLRPIRVKATFCAYQICQQCSLHFKLTRFVELLVYRCCLDLSLYTWYFTFSQESLSSRTNTSCKTVPKITEIDSEICLLFTPLFNVVMISSKFSFSTQRSINDSTKYIPLKNDQLLAV